MKADLRQLLKLAQTGRYAVGHFNTNNLETSQAIIAAAVAQRAPVIIALSESALAYGGRELVAAVRSLINTAAIPAVLHLDHGRSEPIVRQAIDWGFASVMIDGSALGFAHNVRLTRAVVRLARVKKVRVEGELGLIGGQEDTVSHHRLTYPHPDAVVKFVRQTGVDAVAVGLGTSHGLPVPREHIEQTLLDEIRHKIEVPLVLHGASNLAPATIRAAIRRGITKINIDTELRQAFTAGVREALGDRTLYDLRGYLGIARQLTQEVVEKKMRLFGSSKQARP